MIGATEESRELMRILPLVRKRNFLPRICQMQWFSTLNMHMNSLKGLSSPGGSGIWGGPRISTVESPQVMLKLLVQGPHLENYWPWVFLVHQRPRMSEFCSRTGVQGVDGEHRSLLQWCWLVFLRCPSGWPHASFSLFLHFPPRTGTKEIFPEICKEFIACPFPPSTWSTRWPPACTSGGLGTVSSRLAQHKARLLWEGARLEPEKCQLSRAQLEEGFFFFPFFFLLDFPLLFWVVSMCLKMFYGNRNCTW